MILIDGTFVAGTSGFCDRINQVFEAVEGVRENKKRYAEAEAQAALKPKLPMAGFPSFVMSKVIGQEGDGE